jgi:hypothetical protein
MACTRCGALLTPGAKFCPACGKPVPPDPVAPVLAAAVAPPAMGAMPGYAPPGSPIGAGPLPGVTAPRTTNGLAIASMVLGIVWVYWIGSILALVFGYIAKGQINASDGRQGGKGMAIAGIVLGWVGIGCLALMIIALVVGASNRPPPRLQ